MSSQHDDTVVHDDTVLQRRVRRAPDVGCYDGERLELLRQLCYPLTPQAFLKHTWRKRCLHVSGPTSRFDALASEQLSNLSVPALLREAEEIHVWFKPKDGKDGEEGKAGSPATAAQGSSRSWFGEGPSGNASFKTRDSALAASCYKSGGSLYFPAPAAATELLHPGLGRV